MSNRMLVHKGEGREFTYYVMRSVLFFNGLCFNSIINRIIEGKISIIINNNRIIVK